MIAIAEEIARHFIPGERAAKLLHGPRGCGMLRDGDMQNAPAIMGEQHRTNSSRHVTVGTTKKSAEASWGVWFAKKVRHVCDGGFCQRTMYFATVDCETARPSFSSSP